MTDYEKVQQICKVLASKRATEINVLNLQGVSDVADYFVVCSGRSTPLVKALARYVDEEMSQLGVDLKRSEGMREGRWIALDFDNVMVHIFHQEAREFYQLDKLWANGTNLTHYEEEEPKKQKKA